MQKHNQTKRFIHHSLLLNTVSAFSIERKEYRQIIESQNLKLQSLQDVVDKNALRFQILEGRLDAQIGLIDDNSKEIKTLLQENANLTEKVKSQDRVIGDLREGIKSSENLQLHNEKYLEEIKTNSQKLNDTKRDLNVQSGRVKNLELFAERISELHMTLSDPDIRERLFTINYSQKHYEENRKILDWNKLTQEVSAFEKDCVYLSKLSKAVEFYKKTIYPIDREARLTLFRRTIPEGASYEDHIKFVIYSKSKISVKMYYDKECFENEMKLGKFFQNSDAIASYMDWDKGCLNIIFFRTAKSLVYVVNWKEEQNDKRISTTGQVETLEADYMKGGYIILRLHYC